MIQTEALNQIAGLIAASDYVTKLRVGSSGQQPSRDDLALKGTELGNVTMLGSASGNSVTYVSSDLPIPSGTVKEIVVEDATAKVKDRMLLPSLAGAAGATFQFEYTLMVVGAGDN